MPPASPNSANLLALGPGTWCRQRHWHAHEFVFVLTSPTPGILSSTPAIAPASKPVSAMAITCRTAARRPINSRGRHQGSEPHAEYPDIDLRVNAQDYVHKDDRLYS